MEKSFLSCLECVWNIKKKKSPNTLWTNASMFVSDTYPTWHTKDFAFSLLLSLYLIWVPFCTWLCLKKIRKTQINSHGMQCPTFCFFTSSHPKKWTQAAVYEYEYQGLWLLNVGSCRQRIYNIVGNCFMNLCKIKMHNHPLRFGSVTNRSPVVLILQYNHLGFLNRWN